MEKQEGLTQLRVQRRLAHSPENVWKALTDPAEVVQWMQVPSADIDGGPDGHVDIGARLHITGRVLTWDPPRVFEHEFKLAPSKAMPTGEDAILRYELEPDGDGCVLKVTFPRLTPAGARLISGGGLHKGFDRLEAHLAVRAGGP